MTSRLGDIVFRCFHEILSVSQMSDAEMPASKLALQVKVLGQVLAHHRLFGQGNGRMSRHCEPIILTSDLLASPPGHPANEA